MESRKEIMYASAIMAVGIIVAGYFVSETLYKSKQLDRVVTVKGLSEKEVRADLAIWPIQISAVSNDLGELQRDLRNQTRILNDFFREQNFNDDEINIGSPNIQDVKANAYGGDMQYSQYRYIAKVDVTVRTADIAKLEDTEGKIGDIIGKGIIIGSKNYWQQIEYLYTKLNEIKPDMIEEATINAREAAEKFARDSGSKVGKIKTATQGLFSIENRDINTSHIKKVRVVTTVEFYLED